MTAVGRERREQICFWKWIGGRTMKYQKITIWRVFLPKTNCFCHPTSFYRPSNTHGGPTIPIVKNHVRDTKITTNPNPTRRATPHGRRGPTSHVRHSGPPFSFIFIFYFLIITLIPIKDYYAHKLYEITRVRKMFSPINYFFFHLSLPCPCPRRLHSTFFSGQH
jgi:hypothetical protein